MSSWTRFRDKVTGSVSKVAGSGLLGPMGVGLSRMNDTINPQTPGVDPNSPSSVYAGMNREWWADQQRRYLPLEDMANDMVLDPERRSEIIQEGLDATTNAVESSFKRSADRLETLRSRTNQSQSTRSKRSASRLDQLGKAATTVTARNSARDFMEETENTILGG